MGVGGPCLPSLESPPSLGSQRSPFAALPSQEQWKGLRQGGSSAHPLPQPVQQNHLRSGIWGGSRGGGAGEKTQRRPPPYSFLPLELGVSSGLAGGWDVWVGLARQGGSQGALCWIQPGGPWPGSPAPAFWAVDTSSEPAEVWLGARRFSCSEHPRRLQEGVRSCVMPEGPERVP